MAPGIEHFCAGTGFEDAHFDGRTATADRAVIGGKVRGGGVGERCAERDGARIRRAVCRRRLRAVAVDERRAKDCLVVRKPGGGGKRRRRVLKIVLRRQRVRHRLVGANDLAVTAEKNARADADQAEEIEDGSYGEAAFGGALPGFEN